LRSGTELISTWTGRPSMSRTSSDVLIACSAERGIVDQSATETPPTRSRSRFERPRAGHLRLMALLGLLKFPLVRGLVIAILRSRLGRRALRAVFRAVGGRRLLRLVWNQLASSHNRD
jgi:hypothetical protein